jgi:hypothetical protein
MPNEAALVLGIGRRDPTPELSQAAEQPRRGRAATVPQPGRHGDLDHRDQRALVPALPAHATSLRAFRKPAGGTAELAGTSTTTAVSVLAAGPLTAGVTYEF